MYRVIKKFGLQDMDTQAIVWYDEGTEIEDAVAERLSVHSRAPLVEQITPPKKTNGKVKKQSQRKSRVTGRKVRRPDQKHG